MEQRSSTKIHVLSQSLLRHAQVKKCEANCYRINEKYFIILLRYLTLHKFGGVYFDHDIISLREIPYEENFLAVERIRILATAVFGLRKEHPVLTNSLKILVRQK